MAISYIAEQKLPATDDQNNTSATATLDKDASGWATAVNGDFVIVALHWKVTGTTVSVTTTGGQTWTEHEDSVRNGLNSAMYTCVFNGTWTADPVFTNTGAASPVNMWAVLLRGTNGALDTAVVYTSQAASTTFVEATFDPPTDNSWAFVGAGSADNNTWTVDNSFVAPSGSGNVYWRTSGGTDASIVVARKEIASGATGATTMTQATLGADAGYRWHLAVQVDPDALVTPSTVAATVSVPTETTLAGAITAVSAIAATVSLPAPTVTGTGGAEVTTGWDEVGAFWTATTSEVGSYPAASDTLSETGVRLFDLAAAGDALVTPSTIAATVSLPAPTVLAGAITSPSTVAATTTTPAPTLLASAIVQPSTIAATVSLPAATVLAAAMATPSTIAATVSVPTPTVLVGGNVTVSPATVAATVSVPAPTILATAITAPSTIAATVSVPAPTILAAAKPTPATVAASVSVPAPTVRGTAIVTPATTAATVSVPTPAILVGGNATVQPATVAAVASVPSPTVLATARVAPSSIAVSASVPAPSLHSDRTVTPASITISITIPTPTTRGTAIMASATVAALASVPAPQVFGGDRIYITEGDADATSAYLEGKGAGTASIEGDVLVGAGLEG